MEKKPFVPPTPYIDPPSQQTVEILSQMTVRDQKALKKMISSKGMPLLHLNAGKSRSASVFKNGGGEKVFKL